MVLRYDQVQSPKPVSRTAFLPLRLLVALTLFLCATPAFSQYAVTKTVPLGAPDHWDYVVFDPVSDRVFAAHGNTVTAVDGLTGKIVGNVEGLTGGSHGIAIVPQLGRGYTDEGRTGKAVAFDLASLKVLHKMDAELDADAIAFDPVSNHIFVVDGSKLTVIDPVTDAVVGKADGGGQLEYVISGGNGKLYVNGEERHEIVRFDARTNRADAHWNMEGCETPRGIAFDPDTHRLFSGCENHLLFVIDTDSGATVAKLPIGLMSDGIAFDPARKLIFSANFDGTLSIFREKSPNDYVSAGTVKTVLGARTMGLNPKTGRVYLLTADIKLVDPALPISDPKRYSVSPGSVKMLFLDPTR